MNREIWVNNEVLLKYIVHNNITQFLEEVIVLPDTKMMNHQRNIFHLPSRQKLVENWENFVKFQS